MTPGDRAVCLKLLRAAKGDFNEADHRLQSRFPSRAFRYGLIDGFFGRVYSTAGLVPQDAPHQQWIQVKEEYQQGRDLGFSLAKQHKQEQENKG